MGRPPEDDWDVVDDWFTEPTDEERPEEPARDRRRIAEPPRREPPAGRRLAVLAVAVVAVLVAGGALLANVLGDGDGDGETAETTTTAPTVTAPTTTAPTTTTTPTTSTQPAIELPENVTLREGDSGQAVRALQQALRRLDYDPGAVDGQFGAKTREAVAAFQTDAELDADGIAGEATLDALRSRVEP